MITGQGIVQAHQVARLAAVRDRVRGAGVYMAILAESQMAEVWDEGVLQPQGRGAAAAVVVQDAVPASNAVRAAIGPATVLADCGGHCPVGRFKNPEKL